ncbi:thioredoxin family protein [Enterococcus rivorum]|uniref:Uncharacterized protein n=1 Tax=Enterococcus rivorum TaxID=762845 RepID=A0A1E5KWY3_9ENTE|nr:thioredoxin family protein [Enterococcus rivorum]MBP2097281.1 putative bacteriocin transport accessory protein [Enterococcus rivorum]OEH82367.1 hypothetical protein BCR26_02750 [Enterococcus rivorum]
MKKSKLLIAYASMLVAVVTALFIMNSSSHAHREDADYDKLVERLNYSTFEEFEVKKEEKDTFVLFVGQDGCGACEDLMPTLLEISSQDKVRQNIYYMNIQSSNNDSIKTDYGVIATPTLLFIQNGKVVHRMEGSAGENKDKKLIKKQFRNLNLI